MSSEKTMCSILIQNPAKGLEIIMDRYMAFVYTIVSGKLSSVGSKQDIEKCVSDVFFEVYTKRSLIDLEKGSLKAYIAVLSKRAALSVFMKLRNSIDDSPIEGIDHERFAPDSDVGNNKIDSETREAVLQGINELGEPDRHVIIRKYYFGQSVKAISKALGTDENTVNKKASQALNQLRQTVEGEMEEIIIAVLDNLSVVQTDELLDKCMKMKTGGADCYRIKKTVFRKIYTKKEKRIYIPEKLKVLAMILAIVFVALYIVGFGNVVTAFSRLFSFIEGGGAIKNSDSPSYSFVEGVGIIKRSDPPIYSFDHLGGGVSNGVNVMDIIKRSDSTIYSFDPIVGRVSARNAQANIVVAMYGDNYLYLEIAGSGSDIHNKEDITLYINKELYDDRGTMSSSISSGWYATISYEIDAPSDEDIYEIEIAGFSERLSFRLIPCRDFNDVEEIGSSDIQNGISITTVAKRIDNQLTVWFYPNRLTNTTKDTVYDYGYNTNFNKLHIETESGQIFSQFGAGSMTRINPKDNDLPGRVIFELGDNDQTATVRIPYLLMHRYEKRKLRVDLPNGYTTAQCDVSIECSLGTIKITEVTREQGEVSTETEGLFQRTVHKEKDNIYLKIELISADSNMTFSNFEIDYLKFGGWSWYLNKDNGCMDQMGISVEKNRKRISIDITDLYYYLNGEYIIPLDIKTSTKNFLIDH